MKPAAKRALLRLISQYPEDFLQFCRDYIDDPPKAKEHLISTKRISRTKSPVDKTKIDAFDWRAAFQGKSETEIAGALKSGFSLPELRYASKTWRLSSKGKTVEDLSAVMAQAIRTILV